MAVMKTNTEKGYKMHLAVRTEDDKLQSESYDLTLDERNKLLQFMANYGFHCSAEHQAHAPVPTAEWTLDHRLPAIGGADGIQESIKHYPPIGFIGKLNDTGTDPFWEMVMQTKDQTAPRKLLRVAGNILHNPNGPAERLLAVLFNDSNVNQLLSQIQEDSGWVIQNGWAQDTMHIQNLIVTEDCPTEDAVLFLRTLPARMYNITRQSFHLITFDITSEDQRLPKLLADAGYRNIPGTSVYYAYVVPKIPYKSEKPAPHPLSENN